MSYDIKEFKSNVGGSTRISGFSGPEVRGVRACMQITQEENYIQLTTGDAFIVAIEIMKWLGEVSKAEADRIKKEKVSLFLLGMGDL